MRMSRTLGSIQHGGRQEIGILGNKSSVRQRSARTSPPRRRSGPKTCHTRLIYVYIHGCLLESGRQMTVGSSKTAIFASFGHYILRTFTFKATVIILYYVAPYWLFIDTETGDLE